MPLVLVPTPLGNLRDITLRAVDTLRDCALVVAEDSRVTRKLLSALSITGKEIWTYHEHNARTATAGILERARDQLVAVVTDAGMPGISDPGSELVDAARRADIAVEVLPGPSAATSAAVLSGFPIRRFIFEGFPPRSSGSRREALAASFASGAASIWYESPQRVHAFLRDVDAVDPAASVFLLREYTKIFEQQLRGSAKEVAAGLEDPARGEVVVVLLPSPRVQAAASDEELDERIDGLLAQNAAIAAIAKALSDEGFGERRAIYARAAARKSARRDARGQDDR